MLIVTEVLNCHSDQILRKTQDIIDGEFHNVVVLRRAVSSIVRPHRHGPGF